MKLQKMKITQFILLLLFSFQLSAQIPDSLQVELPWESLRLNDCAKSMGEGPRSENENVVILLASDVTVDGSLDLCVSRTRTWEIYDLLGGAIYTFTQVGSPAVGSPLNCQENLIITLDQLPYALNIDDVVSSPNASHEYSFDYNDIDDDARVINSANESTYEFFVYNHTLLKVCKVNVYLTDCEEDITLDFPETAEVVFNREPYIEVTPEMLGVEVIYPCSGFSTEVRILDGNSNRLSSKFVGGVVAVYVETSFNDGSEYLKIIEVTVSGEKPDALPMYIEDKSFVAGETVEIEVWSDDLLGLTAWQLQLQFEDVEILDILPGQVFGAVPINIMDDVTARALWFPATGLPIDVETKDTWFTLVLIPDNDGTTFDIFKTAQDPWSAIAIDDLDYIFEYEAEFLFNVASRGVLSTDNEISDSNIEVFPNPSSHQISISGLPNPNSPSKIEVFNLEGKLMIQKELTIQNSVYTLDVSTLPNGIFILKTKNGNTLTTHKISKI